MIRKVKFAFAALALAVVVAGCTPRQLYRADPGTIVHVVLVKLKDAGQQSELVQACRDELGTIGTVRRWTYGPPVDTGRGERVDSAYDLALTFEFRSRENYQRYLESEKHVRFIERWGSKFEKLRVFDYMQGD